MEKIELLEKLVEVQEKLIELMQDYNNLKCYKDLDHTKNIRIQQLNKEIEYKDEKIVELERQNAELKQQYEELQKSLITTEEK